jgi:putative queuosine salvage protein
MTTDPVVSIPDQVRAGCAWVACEAESVRVAEELVEDYARGLPAADALAGPDPGTQLLEGNREALAAFVICLDAINFGSGWWPTIRKRPGLSGHSTIAAGVTERFRTSGAWAPQELARIRPADVAEVVGQEPDHPLMPQFAAALRDVGSHVLADHHGRFEALVDAAAGSALALTGLLSSWRAFADASLYKERPVPFYKRAQLAAADLDRAGVASFADRHRLTAFADNLVPHVLRVDGVLELGRDLKDAIEAGELLPHGSPAEVELRAGAVHAVELLAAAGGGRLAPAEIDAALWNRGRAPRYKAIPRPRSRNTAY